jgi:hypothetical protein
MTSISCPSKIKRWVGNTCTANSSRTSLAIRFATIQLPGLRIIYDDLATVRDNFALSAHAELMNSCEAPTSNKMKIGCPKSKKVLATTSPSVISSTVVWLTRPLLGIGSLN